MTDTGNTDYIAEDQVAPSVEESPQAETVLQENLSQDQSGQTDEQKNWAAMRNRQDELERRLAERDQIIEALQGQVSQYGQNPQVQEEEIDELDSLAPDEWLTKEQSAKLAQRQAQQAVKLALEEERKRRMQEELPDRIKREYPDFDQVVSKENIDYLKAQKPHLAQVLAATQDPYIQAKSVYDAVKAFCPSVQVTNDKQKAEKNALRPGSIDSAGPPRTQDYDPRRLTAETKAQLWREMQEAARG